jgi:Rrf2 family protein
MITQKAKYAFKALFHMAALPLGTSIRIEEIAEGASVPRKFLEHILLDLKKRAIVKSNRGRAGGYTLVKRPDEMTISDILRAIDGPIAPLPCISRTAYRRCEDCKDEKTCSVRRLFADTYAATLALWEGTTLAEAFAQNPAQEGPRGKSVSKRL